MANLFLHPSPELQEFHTNKPVRPGPSANKRSNQIQLLGSSQLKYLREQFLLLVRELTGKQGKTAYGFKMLAPSWCLIYRHTCHSLSQRGGKTLLDLDRTQTQ